MTETPFKHSFMKSEIFEQPSVVQSLFGCLKNFNFPKTVTKICFIASGSSYNASAIIASLIKKEGTVAVFPGEFNEKITPETFFVFVSQSGETYDTSELMKKVLRKTKNVAVVSNCKNSFMAKNAPFFIPAFCGKENGIAATKSVCAQLVALLWLVKSVFPASFSVSENLPETISGCLNGYEKINEISKKLQKFAGFEILGSGEFLYLAREAALKIKEITYLPTAFYPCGEFLHGHCAVLNSNHAVIAFANEEKKSFMKNCLKRLKKNYNPFILTFAKDGDYFEDISDEIFEISGENPIEEIFSFLICSQMLSLTLGENLGKNVDSPEGLSKIVGNN